MLIVDIMKHLYVIGNGFDLFTGLNSKFSDFGRWLKYTYPFVHEVLFKVYSMDGEWWKDFEFQLGKLDIERYIREYEPVEILEDEKLKELKKRVEFEQKYNLPPSMDYSSPSARNLSGMFAVLHNCLREWIQCCQYVIVNPKRIDLETKGSFFINFNYTDVLERVYGIPDERVFHIHGRASQSDRLIFGHDSVILDDGSLESEQVSFELGKYRKFPYGYIGKYEGLTEVVNDVEFVHIYGLSFSPVDVDYIDWIYKHTPRSAKWEVSWFTEEDRAVIDEFVDGCCGLGSRLEYVRLGECCRLKDFNM